MAVRLATTADYLQRTTSLPSNSGDRTVMYWVRIRSQQPLSPDYRFFYGLIDDPVNYTAYIETWATARDAGSPLSASTIYGEGWHTPQSTPPPRVNGGAIANYTWAHHALVSSGTTHELFINGVSKGTFSYDGSSDAYGYELLGNDTYSVGDQDMAYFRQWSAALTANEIRTEMAAPSAVRTSNLFADTPLESDALDVSGNGRDWTEVGTVSYISNGPWYSTGVVYKQDWSSGNASPPMQVAGGGGATEAYPYNTLADECQVATSRLQHWSGSGDWSTMAWREALFGVEAGGYMDGSRLRATVPIHVLAAAMTDNEGGYAVLFNIDPKGADSSRIQVAAYEQGSPGTDTWILELIYDTWQVGGTVTRNTYTFSRAAVEDTDVDLVIDWKDATVDWVGNTASTDGWLKVYFGGSLVYDEQNIKLYSGGSAAAADVHLIQAYSMGYGLIGTVGTIVFDVPSDGSPSVSVPTGYLYVASNWPSVWNGEVAPEPGESFGPLIWAEWSGSDSTKRYWAPVDLPDPSTYYGGYKSPKLLAAGLVTRALSDEDGNLQSQRFDITASDVDRDVRALLGQSDERRHIFNTLLVLRMISDRDRRALLTPRTVAIGVVREYELG